MDAALIDLFGFESNAKLRDLSCVCARWGRQDGRVMRLWMCVCGCRCLRSLSPSPPLLSGSCVLLASLIGPESQKPTG